MGLELYLSFMASAVVLIIIPGPTNMVVLSSSLKFGFRKSLWTVLGAAASHTFFIAVTCLGVATILMVSARFFEWIRWVGVIYLLYLGIRLWCSERSEYEVPESRPIVSRVSLFFQGFAVNTTNPKALLFYSAFFPPL